MVIRTGQHFAGYELEDLVGEGQMGAVYKARDLRLQRSVALRIVSADLATDAVTRARLNRESTALASADHPNVAPIYEAGERDGKIFIASRWVDGVSLSTLARDHGPLEPRRAVRIVSQVAAALQATHGLGIMHRNVKPSSVLVTPADYAYLTDFGLARRSQDMTGLTMQEQLLEAFDYVAPEHIEGADVDARIDIYGLGCVLYEALTAEVPFPRSGPAAKMYAHVSAEPPSARRQRPDVPERLDAVIRRAMAKDPAERQQTAGEFAIDAAGAVDMSAPLWATSPRLDPPPQPDGDGSGVIAHAPVARDGNGFGLVDGAAAAEPPGGPAGTPDGYHEPVYFQSRRRPARRWLLWTLAVVLFIAAPVALVLALAGSG
jgi:serine/threonine protein kinase